jgi:hypothetical protein
MIWPVTGNLIDLGNGNPTNLFELAQKKFVEVSEGMEYIKVTKILTLDADTLCSST